jgi:hypothetical protein
LSLTKKYMECILIFINLYCERLNKNRCKIYKYLWNKSDSISQVLVPWLVFVRVSSMVCISQSVFYGLYLSVSSMIGICQNVLHNWYLSECLLWFVFLRVSSIIGICQHKRHSDIPIMENTLTNTNHRRHSDKYQLWKTLWEIQTIEDTLTNTNYARHVFVRVSTRFGISQSVFYGLYLSECLPWLVFIRMSCIIGICQSVFYGGRHSDKYQTW